MTKLLCDLHLCIALPFMQALYRLFEKLESSLTFRSVSDF